MTPDEKEKLMEKLDVVFSKIGLECAAEMLPLLKEMHPDAQFIQTLYRSAIVVLKQKQEEMHRGKVTILLYHDPHWMGHDMTKETLPGYCDRLEVWGQRSGPDLTLNGQFLVPMSEEEKNKFYGMDDILKAAQEARTGKGEE